MLKSLFKISFIFILTSLYAQQPVFTHQDTLRGSITNERIWWDLTHYDLAIDFDVQNKSLKGTNTITYKVLQENQRMQLDLQPPMDIVSVRQDGKQLNHLRNGNVYYIVLDKNQVKDSTYKISVEFKGTPKESKNPPWDDGLTWSKDKNNNDFIATTCQGGGASIWWPCKDHMYDEPDDGVKLSITTPRQLMGVANGRLINTINNSNQTKTYVWKVINPINNYGINMNIGDYVHFSDNYHGEKGDLKCDYYVLSYNLEKAKKQFKQANLTLEAFEHWFGPYPFYEDSFKLVEVPYLGMEHQSSVTYGNEYQNGYRGKDLSATGWGLKFDFIIVHESGHEWFGNNITNKDIADMWIHESFTAYSENLFLDYHYGTEASNAYVTGTRKLIKNDRPIIGFYNVNHSGSGDMYYKGSNMLHTLRQIVNDDEKWRTILRGLNKKFYHQTVTSSQIENYLSEHIGIDLNSFFDQYLRTTKIPTLEYDIKGSKILYRWANVVDNFYMPLKISINDQDKWIIPNNSWQKIQNVDGYQSLVVDPNFYIKHKNISDIE